MEITTDIITFQQNVCMKANMCPIVDRKLFVCLFACSFVCLLVCFVVIHSLVVDVSIPPVSPHTHLVGAWKTFDHANS